MLLDHEPLVALASGTPTFHLDQGEVAFEALSIEPELQVTLAQHGRGLGFGAGNIFSIYGYGRQGLPCAHVPYHDAAGAIVTFRDVSFEIEVRHGVIFHLHGESFVGRIERGSFGHSPGL